MKGDENANNEWFGELWVTLGHRMHRWLIEHI